MAMIPIVVLCKSYGVDFEAHASRLYVVSCMKLRNTMKIKGRFLVHSRYFEKHEKVLLVYF